MADIRLTTTLDGADGVLTALRRIGKEAAAIFVTYKITQYVKEVATLSARIQTLDVVMTTVGKNAGYTRDQMQEFADGVRKMGITLQESRSTIINMVQAQIDLSNASRIARIAQDAAVIGNINSSEALSRLIYGLKSAQVEVLRTMGLNVNFQQGYEKLAAQLGKNVNSLTQAEKAQARVNVVMEAGEVISGAYADAMLTAGKALTSLPRYLEDLKATIGEVFLTTMSFAIREVTLGLKTLLNRAEELSANGTLNQWSDSLAESFAVVVNWINNAIVAFRLWQLEIAHFTARNAVKAGEEIVNMLSKILWFVDKTKEEWRKQLLKDSQDPETLLKAIEEEFKNAQKGIDQGADLIIRHYREFIAKYREARAKGFATGGAKSPSVIDADTLDKETAKAMEALRKMNEEIEREIALFGKGEIAAVKWALSHGEIGKLTSYESDLVRKNIIERTKELVAMKEVQEASEDALKAERDHAQALKEKSDAYLDALDPIRTYMRLYNELEEMNKRGLLTEREVAQVLANEKVKGIEASIEAIERELDLRQRAIDVDVQANLITEFQAWQRLSKARNEAADKLRAILEQLEAIKEKTPEVTKAIEDIKAKLEELEKTADVLAIKMRGTWQSAFTDEMKKVIKGAESLEDAIRNMAARIVDVLLDMALQVTANQIWQTVLGPIMGGVSGGTSSGILGFFSGLFGGGANAGIAGDISLFQHGGSFKVGGNGGVDSRLVRFMATPGEEVTIRTPEQQRALQSADRDSMRIVVRQNITVGSGVDLNTLRHAMNVAREQTKADILHSMRSRGAFAR